MEQNLNSSKHFCELLSLFNEAFFLMVVSVNRSQANQTLALFEELSSRMRNSGYFIEQPEQGEHLGEPCVRCPRSSQVLDCTAPNCNCCCLEKVAFNSDESFF